MSLTPHQVLKKYWGYDDFRPRQLDIITSVLSGNDTLGLLPTGGGKSLTFQVPAMMLPGLTVVVTPLVSLMKDQVDNLLDRGIRAVYLYAGLSRREVRLAYDRCQLGKSKLLYVSPERLRSQAFIDQLRGWNVSLIVVDEAHCISQWGYDFRPSYLQIAALRDVVGRKIPVLALTASATPVVRDDIMRQLQFTDTDHVFSLSFDRSNLSYVVRITDSKADKLLDVLTHTSGTAIVYVRSRLKTKQIAEQLTQQGISAEFYHAGLCAEDKADRQDRWKRGEVRVMVATNAFGMGIDKADVRLVVHYDAPPSLEEYYQEAGRAGRDGLHSFAVVLAAQADKGVMTRRINDAFPPIDFVRRVYELAGNFLSIPVGEGFNQVYEFDLGKFCTVYKLNTSMVRGALALLTQAGYFEFVDEAPTRSRVMMLCQRDELYGMEITGTTERVLLSLLRLYTGLFSEYVYINENDIARQTDIDADVVYESLLALGRMKVLHYVPRKAIPYIYYTTARELPKHVVLSNAVYAERRRLMEHRVEAVKKFIFDTDTCRSRTLLEYFGEKVGDDCGRCDVCRARAKRHARPTGATDRHDKAIIRIAGTAGISIDELSQAVGMERTELVERLRVLREEGKITVVGMRVSAGK